MLSTMAITDTVLGRKSNVGPSLLYVYSRLPLSTAHDEPGDMKRPTCSRCIESGWNCIYSTAKKKPGPARGARRRASKYYTFIDTQPSSPHMGLISSSSSRPAQSQSANSSTIHDGLSPTAMTVDQVSFPPSDSTFLDAISVLHPSVTTQTPGDFSQPISWPTPAPEQLAFPDHCLTFDQEHEL